MPYTDPLVSESYDRDRLWEYEAPDRRANRLRELLEVDGGTCLCEIGCGTGYYLHRFLETTRCTVAGIDKSHLMLDIANKKLDKFGDRCELHIGSADALPLEDNTVEAVLCHHAIHHFADIHGFVAEAKRVLCDGGRLAVVSISHLQIQSHPIYQLLPYIVDIDLERTPDTSTISSVVAKHFSEVAVHTVDVSDVQIPADDVILGVRNGFMSCIRLLTDEQHEEAYRVFLERIRQGDVKSFPAESYTIVLARA